MPPITTLLFDLDETLVRSPDDGAERLAAAFETAGVEPFFTLEDFARWMPRVEAEGPLDLRLKCFSEIAAETGRSTADAEAVARAFEMPTAAEFEPVDGATAVVETVRERGYDLGLVTNGPEPKQREKLRLLGLEDAFDAAVFGDPDRGLKPATEPLTVALEAIGAAPARAAKIGDRMGVDIEPANRLGMTTVWIPPNPDAAEGGDEADVVVDRLEHLLDEPWAGN